jgi:hypothetical protein
MQDAHSCPWAAPTISRSPRVNVVRCVRHPLRGSHLTIGLPHVRTLLALALSLLSLLVLPVIAAGRTTPCATHARHSAHACSAHRPSARRRHAAKRDHRRHGPARTRAAAGSTPTSAKGASPASCEDGYAAVAGAGGTLSCADGGEPACEDGSSPASSGPGASLLCPVSSAQAPGAGEATCEDGTGNPCANGEEPDAPGAACPGGFSLMSMGDGSSPFCEREQ